MLERTPCQDPAVRRDTKSAPAPRSPRLRIAAFLATPRIHPHAAHLLPALLGLALAACGNTSPSNDGTTIPPIPAAHAGKALDAAIGTAPLDVNRHVPGGVFFWHIELNGQIEKQPANADSRAHHLARVHRVIEGTAHMRGQLANGDLPGINPELHPQATPTAESNVIDDLAKAIESCGDDTACQQATAMKMVSNPTSMAAIQSAANSTINLLGRIDVWTASESCTARVEIDDIDDTTAWVEDYGEGYNNSRWVTTTTQWQADRQVSCSNGPLERGVDATLVYLDTQTHQVDITFGELALEANVRVNGKADAPRRVVIPSLSVAAQPAAAEGQPFHGEATLDVAGSRDPPLTAHLIWRFEPRKD